jgi:hypothetical protein
MKSVRKDSIYVPVNGKDEEYELLLTSMPVGDNWYIREECGKIKVTEVIEANSNIAPLYRGNED